MPTEPLRRFRLWFSNIPILSYLAFRYTVLQGSVVMDYALTLKAARRRATRHGVHWYIEYPDGSTVPAQFDGTSEEA